MRIFKFYLYRLSRNWMMFFLILCLPIAHIYTTYLQYASDFQYKIGVVDQADDQLSHMLIEQLTQNNVSIQNYMEIEEAKEQLIKNEIEYIIVLEADIKEKMIQHGDFSGIYGISIHDDATSLPLKMKMNSSLSAIKTLSGIQFADEEAVSNALNKLEQKQFQVIERIEGDKSKDIYIGLVNVLAFDIFFLLISISLIFLKDKERGLYSRIMVSPVTAASFYMQSISLFVFIGALQFIIGYSFISLLIGFSTVLPYAWIVAIYFAPYVVSIAMLGQMIFAISRNATIGMSLLPVVVLPLGMLSGQLWPREIMPVSLQYISACLPTSWIVMLNKSIIMYGLSFAEAIQFGAYFVAFLGLGGAFLYFAVKKDGKKHG